jgi:hypothetical protein
VDFTVECWVYLTAYSSGGVTGGALFGTANGSTNGYFINTGQDINTLRITSNASGTWADNISVTTGNGLPLNQWTHIAFVRSGAVLTLYKNGTSVGSLSGASAYNFTSPGNAGYVAFASDGSFPRYVPGYISNVRIIKGQALATGNFTIPTSPLTTTTVGWTGANAASSISGTVSLLTCQSNRFKDNANNLVITTSGTPQNQAFQPFSPASSYTAGAYGGSGYFNGSTDYLSIADNTALQLAAGDFTIEGWFYISGVTSTAYNLISKGAATTGWSLNTTTGARIQFSYTTSNLTGATTTLVQGAWYHIAVVRSGSSSGNLKIYLNGAQEVASAGAVTDNFNQTDLLYVSASRTATIPLNGYSSNVRIVKGVPVYTGAFTPPTLAPLTTSGSTSAASYSSTTNVNTSFASSSTSLLTNFTNAGVYDAAVLTNQITTGSAQASTSQYKWSPTSIKLNGTTDYITIPEPFGIITSLVGITSWTVECWFYNTNTSASSTYVFCKGGRRDTSVSPSYGLSVIGSTGSGVFVIGNNTVSFGSAYSFTYPSSTFATNAWVYFAAVRSSAGVITTYVNGTLQSTSGSGISLVICANESFSIGSAIIAPANAFTGYIEDFRITKGVARTITASPTSAFPTR